jgi:hypothetical protein
MAREAVIPYPIESLDGGGLVCADEVYPSMYSSRRRCWLMLMADLSSWDINRKLMHRPLEDSRTERGLFVVTG